MKFMHIMYVYPCLRIIIEASSSVCHSGVCVAKEANKMRIVSNHYILKRLSYGGRRNDYTVANLLLY